MLVFVWVEQTSVGPAEDESVLLDETEDRNKNGVIDSIDDTIDLMRVLLQKGYKEGKDMQYLQLPKGKHDVPTWAKAFPTFLKWGWGNKVQVRSSKS